MAGVGLIRHTVPCTMRHNCLTTSAGIGRAPHIAPDRHSTGTRIHRGGNIGEIALAVTRKIAAGKNDRRAAGYALGNARRR